MRHKNITIRKVKIKKLHKVELKMSKTTTNTVKVETNFLRPSASSLKSAIIGVQKRNDMVLKKLGD